MTTSTVLPRFTCSWRLLWLALLATAALLMGPLAHAQEDPPGRVGRLAELNGGVSWFDAEQGQWQPAERNRPLTTGDRIATGRDGRAELRVGSTTLRLSNSSELEVLRLDDARLVFQLHGGGLAVRVRSADVASDIELVTDEARMLPLQAGLYRVDRIDDTTQAGAWRGELRVDGAAGVVVAAGQRITLQRADRPGDRTGQRPVWSNVPNDGFSAWVLAEEGAEERTVATRYVSAEMTGAEDLDRAGRWEQHPEFGAVWTPVQVQPDWAPYRYGRWAWVQPWGWTWVDDAPWGFAPFHYGRWAFWQERWRWVPGAYVARPVFAPALVAWVGGGSGGSTGWGVSVRIGGPPVGWVPLAPREPYRPYYRSTPVYVQRINPEPRYRWQHPPGQFPGGPLVYGNQGVRNAVTVVPGDVLIRRQPVARAAIEVRGDWRGEGRGDPRGDARGDGRWDGRGDGRFDGRPNGDRNSDRNGRGDGRGDGRGEIGRGPDDRRDGRGPDQRTETRPDGRPEIRPDTRSDTRPDLRPDLRPNRGGRPDGVPFHGQQQPLLPAAVPGTSAQPNNGGGPMQPQAVPVAPTPATAPSDRGDREGRPDRVDRTDRDRTGGNAGDRWQRTDRRGGQPMPAEQAPNQPMQPGRQPIPPQPQPQVQPQPSAPAVAPQRQPAVTPTPQPTPSPARQVDRPRDQPRDQAREPQREPRAEGEQRNRRQDGPPPGRGRDRDAER